MLLDVIGCSPAWPNPGQAHAGYLVTASSGERLLLDCGPGVLSRLRKRERLPIDAIAITHLHLDHWGDLVPWCWLRGPDAQRGALRPELWLPPGGLASLDRFAALFGSDRMFERTFVVKEYSPGEPFTAAGCQVEAIPVAHYDVQSFGFRVVDDAVLSYSGDSAPCEALGELAESADLFLCEATLSKASDDSEPRGHLTAEEAGEAAGTARLLLVHRPAELGAAAGAELAVPDLHIEL